MTDLATLPEIEALVRALGVPESVCVEWSDAASYVGRAEYWHGEDHFRTVTFSRKYWPHLSAEARRLVVIHEAAHVLRPPGDHHSPQWRALCISLGGDGKRCTNLSDEVRSEVYLWTGTCPNGHQVFRHRLTKKTRGHSCGVCRSVYSPLHKFNWKENR
jgi:hypothetical protein